MKAYLSPVKDFNMLLFFILCYLLDSITSFDFSVSCSYRFLFSTIVIWYIKAIVLMSRI